MKHYSKQRRTSEFGWGILALEDLCPLVSQPEGMQEQEYRCVAEPIIECLPIGAIIVNSEGRFTIFNREARRILGMGPQDVEYTSWPQTYGCYFGDKITLYPPDRLPLVRALHGETVVDELMFIRNPERAQGVWIRVNCTPLPDLAGVRGWAAAVFTDVTERRKMNERIELLSRAVEQTADSVLITDQAGRIEYVNRAFEHTTGYLRQEVVGNTPRMLNSGYHDAEFYNRLWTTILAGKTFRATIRNRKKSGELYWAEQTIGSITNDAGKVAHFVSVLKDITESRKQQEQEIQMRLAREVQQRFYNATLTVPGLDAGAAVHPAEQTGGDYVDFFTANHSLGVAIGDVSTHGFGAALVMALTRAYTRSFFAQGLGVGKVLEAVNHMLHNDLEENQYVTLLLLSVDVADSVISYSNAGHVPGLILSESGELEGTLTSTGIPLGIRGEHRTGTRLLPLRSKQTIVLLTDGLTEAGEPEQFGTERVIEYVRHHQRKPAQQIADGLCDTVRRYTRNEPQQDDISVVIIKKE